MADTLWAQFWEGDEPTSFLGVRFPWTTLLGWGVTSDETQPSGYLVQADAGRVFQLQRTANMLTFTTFAGALGVLALGSLWFFKWRK